MLSGPRPAALRGGPCGRNIVGPTRRFIRRLACQLAPGRKEGVSPAIAGNPPLCVQAVVRRDDPSASGASYLKGQRGSDVRVQRHSDLVGTRGLDGRRHPDHAPVELRSTRSDDRIRDVTWGDRAK